MPWGHRHRFPVAPALARSETKRALARGANISYALILNPAGLTSRSADAVAAAVGLHPANLWPEWWEVTEAEDRCGTPAGYNAHRRFGETPCPECLAAECERGRQRRQAAKAVA